MGEAPEMARIACRALALTALLFLFGTSAVPATAQNASNGFAVIEPSVVRIWTFDTKGKVIASATGFVVASNGQRSFILTARHAVAGASDVRVDLRNETTQKASVVTMEQQNDIALLRINQGNLKAVRFAFRQLNVGDTIAATGFYSSEASAAQRPHLLGPGMISSLTNDDRVLGFDNLNIQAGLSGGPIFDIRTGSVLGMVVSREEGTAIGGYAVSAPLALIGFIRTAGVDVAVESGPSTPARRDTPVLPIAAQPLPTPTPQIVYVPSPTQPPEAAEPKPAGTTTPAVADIPRFEAAVNANPNDVVAMTQLATGYMQAQHPELAVPITQKLLAGGTKNVQVLYIDGEANAKLGNTDAGIASMQQASNLEPTNMQIIEALVQMYVKVNRPADAERLAKRGVNFNPKDPRANYVLGEVYMTAANWKSAREAFEASLNVSATADALVGLAAADHQTKNYTEEIQIYEALDKNAAPLIKANPILLFNMATAYKSADQLPKAKNAYVRYLEFLKPGTQGYAQVQALIASVESKAAH